MKSNSCFEDGGDCTDFITKYPNCNADAPARVGNNNCDGQYFNKYCGMDGGEFSMVSIILLYSLALTTPIYPILLTQSNLSFCS